MINMLMKNVGILVKLVTHVFHDVITHMFRCIRKIKPIKFSQGMLMVLYFISFQASDNSSLLLLVSF